MYTLEIFSKFYLPAKQIHILGHCISVVEQYAYLNTNAYYWK